MVSYCHNVQILDIHTNRTRLFSRWKTVGEGGVRRTDSESYTPDAKVLSEPKRASYGIGNNNSDNNVYNLYIDPIAYDNRLTFLTTFPSISMYVPTTTSFTMCAFVPSKLKKNQPRPHDLFFYDYRGSSCSIQNIVIVQVILLSVTIERVNNK